MNWKETVELLGIGAIVASLIFVGLQLRQSQQIAIAAQYQERANTGLEFYYNTIQIESQVNRRTRRLQRLIDLEALSDFDKGQLADLPPEDWAETDIVAIISILIFDNLHFQYQSGFVNEESWSFGRERLRNVLRNNYFARRQIMENGDRFRSGFVEVAQRLIREIEAADN